MQWQHVVRDVPVSKQRARRDVREARRQSGVKVGADGSRGEIDDTKAPELLSRRIELESRFSDHLHFWLPQFR